MADELHPLVSPSVAANPLPDGSDYRVPLGDTAGRQIVRGEDQLFSYKESYAERLHIDSAPAGGNTLQGTEVPAGEVWCVSFANCMWSGAACTHYFIRLNDGVNVYTLDTLQGPVSSEYLVVTGNVYVPAGWLIESRFLGVGAGDRLYAHFVGYKMTVES